MRPTLVQFRPDTWAWEFTHPFASEQLDSAMQATEGAGAGRYVAWGNDTAIARTGKRGHLKWMTSLAHGTAARGKTQVTVGAVACATMHPDDCYTLACNIASRFGEIEDVRITRLDLAADIAGIRPSEIEATDWVVLGNPRRVRNRSAPVSQLGHVRDWYAADGAMTGWTVAPGNAIKVNLYDKPRELRRPESEHKRGMETMAWALGGWDGAAPVSRLEFQLKAQALKELGVEPAAVDIDAVWSYCVTRWARVIDSRSHHRRDRCDLHPMWRAAMDARWHGPALPAERVRHRAGPTAACALGTVRALLASRGALPESATVEEYAAAFSELAKAELSRALNPDPITPVEPRTDRENNRAARSARMGAEAVGEYLERHHARVKRVYGPQKR